MLNALAATPNVHSEDIIHRAMKWQIGLLPLILIWGLIMETLFAFGTVKTFDLQSVFAAILFYEGGVATLLGSGTAAMFFRKIVSPDGTESEENSITKGQQPDVTVNTNIIKA